MLTSTALMASESESTIVACRCGDGTRGGDAGRALGTGRGGAGTVGPRNTGDDRFGDGAIPPNLASMLISVDKNESGRPRRAEGGPNRVIRSSSPCKRSLFIINSSAARSAFPPCLSNKQISNKTLRTEPVQESQDDPYFARANSTS